MSKMKRLLCSAWMAVLAAGPLALAAAAPDKADELAGEREEVRGAQGRPETAEPEEAGKFMSVTRSTKNALSANFDLPEAVVTAAGEHKASSTRPDLGGMMDTLAGSRTAPGEQEGPKHESGAAGKRLDLGDRTGTSRPSYGRVDVLAGLAGTLEGSLLWGEERKDLYYLLELEGARSDGGPVAPFQTVLNQNQQSGFLGQGGTRLGNGAMVSVDLEGKTRSRFWTRSSFPDPRMDRSLLSVAASYDGPSNAAFRHTLQLSAERSQILLPGFGTVWTESLLGAHAELSRTFLQAGRRLGVSGEFSLQSLGQDTTAGSRSPLLATARLIARMDLWEGARFGLGVNGELVSGGPDSSLLAIRAEFDQRLGDGLGLWLRLDPRLAMGMAMLHGDLFEKDPALPGLGLAPAKDILDLEAGINAALAGNMSLELVGFVRQNENAAQLTGISGAPGLWSALDVGAMRVVGLELRQGMPLGSGWRQDLRLRLSNATVLDHPGWQATFAPVLAGDASLGWAQGRWKLAVQAVFEAERREDLAAPLTLAPYLDLRASAAWEFNGHLSLKAEGRNLLSQPVQEFSGYAEPSPFVGLGAAYQF